MRAAYSFQAATLALLVSMRSYVAADNEVIDEPNCDSSKAVSIRYASSTKRLYVESGSGSRGGCATLTDIYNSIGGSGPLYPVNPSSGSRTGSPTGTWLLTEDLYVEDGITLKVHGGSDGDCDELRLLSDSSTYINLRGHGGSLSFHDTKVFAWDEGDDSYDKDYGDGRSYINVISEVIVDSSEDCDGAPKNNMGEARMDIVNSEMAYLGYYASESYGLVWKVRGFCVDESNKDIFDEVNVYGNIYDSEIHHNYFGMYTYGHQQGDWRRNVMRDNIEYGFDPHDDSDKLNIHDNTVYGNGNHGIIASKRCNDVSIQGNKVYDGGNVGIFLHRSSDDAIVTGNTVYGHDDAGMALMEAFRATVQGNSFEDNTYGIRLSVGSADNVFKGNDIIGSSKYNIYTYEGSDDPYTVSSGRCKDNEFSDNNIEGGSETIKLEDSDGTLFVDNAFSDVSTLRFSDSTDVLMSGNTGLGGSFELKVEGGSCFDPASDSGFTPTC